MHSKHDFQPSAQTNLSLSCLHYKISHLLSHYVVSVSVDVFVLCAPFFKNIFIHTFVYFTYFLCLCSTVCLLESGEMCYKEIYLLQQASLDL